MQPRKQPCNDKNKIFYEVTVTTEQMRWCAEWTRLWLDRWLFGWWMEKPTDAAFWVSNLRGWFFHWVGAQVQGLKNPSFPPHANRLTWLLRLETISPHEAHSWQFTCKLNFMTTEEDILLYLHVNTDSYCKVFSIRTLSSVLLITNELNKALKHF